MAIVHKSIHNIGYEYKSVMSIYIIDIGRIKFNKMDKTYDFRKCNCKRKPVYMMR